MVLLTILAMFRRLWFTPQPYSIKLWCCGENIVFYFTRAVYVTTLLPVGIGLWHTFSRCEYHRSGYHTHTSLRSRVVAQITSWLMQPEFMPQRYSKCCTVVACTSTHLNWLLFQTKTVYHFKLPFLPGFFFSTFIVQNLCTGFKHRNLSLIQKWYNIKT